MAKRKTLNPKESTIQANIISYLKVRRILFNRINNGQFFIEENVRDKYGRQRRKKRAVRCNSINGLSDIEVFGVLEKNGKPLLPIIIYLEVKTKTGRQSHHQKLFQQRIESAGGFYYVVRSIDDVKKAFEKTVRKIKETFGKEYDLAFLKAFSLVELNGTKKNNWLLWAI